MILVRGGAFEMGDGVRHARYAAEVGDLYVGRHEVTNRELAEVYNWALDNGKIYIAVGAETKARPEPPYAMGEKRPDFMYMDLPYLVRYDKKTFWPLIEPWRESCGVEFRDGRFVVREGREEYPAVAVSWIGAVSYCNYLSEREGLKPAYETTFWDILPKTNGYRLPTNEEWEWAARGGQLTKGFSCPGGDDPDAIGWFMENSDGTVHPVGEKEPNELGLNDMGGNVWEFCTERFGTFRGIISSGGVGALMGSYHLWRGGSCTSPELSVHMFRQHIDSPGYLQGADDLGFRVFRPVR